MNEDKQSSDTKSVVELSNGSSGEFCTEHGPNIMDMAFFISPVTAEIPTFAIILMP